MQSFCVSASTARAGSVSASRLWRPFRALNPTSKKGGRPDANQHRPPSRVKWLDDPAPYEVKRANDERDKRYARIAKARKAQKRKTRQ